MHVGVISTPIKQNNPGSTQLLTVQLIEYYCTPIHTPTLQHVKKSNPIRPLTRTRANEPGQGGGLAGHLQPGWPEIRMKVSSAIPVETRFQLHASGRSPAPRRLHADASGPARDPRNRVRGALPASSATRIRFSFVHWGSTHRETHTHKQTETEDTKRH